MYILLEVKKFDFEAIFAQVRAPRAKMAEKCEKVLISVKVIDMIFIGSPESLFEALYIDYLKSFY